MPNEVQETCDRNTVKMQDEEDSHQEHATLQAERAHTFATAAAPSDSHPALYEVLDCIQHARPQHKVEDYICLLCNFTMHNIRCPSLVKEKIRKLTPQARSSVGILLGPSLEGPVFYRGAGSPESLWDI